MRALNGWTVMWIGERAFRAPAAVKEQIESLGYQVKIYRSHDKCSRALDKKSNVAPTHIFLVSEADAEPLLSYFSARRQRHMHFVVDGESSVNPTAVQMLPISGCVPEESYVWVAFTWDQVLGTLRDLSIQASMQIHVQAQHDAAAGYAEELLPPASVPAQQGDFRVSDTPWTLVWVSDQAFKPAATGQKAQLEAMGCQVKGYKTHKNAARALDKKRALVRTVVLVSGAEAAPFLAYLSSRPEIAGTPVVVEASSRAVPVREGPTCRVAEDFEGALEAVWAIAADPGFT